MKKIFIDIYLAYNLGDDLFLDVLVKRYPNCEFTLNYVGDNYDQFISQYNNVKRRKYSTLNKIGQRLRISNFLTNYNQIAEAYDALIFIGGSIFREEEYHHSLYQDRINMVRQFKNRNKPVFVTGANFGPFHTSQYLNDYMEFFKLCDDVCFRDMYSFELFKGLSQVRYAPDIVFQMNVNEYRALAQKNRVGFSIIDVRHKQGLSKYYDKYISSTVKSVEGMVKKGYECYLMSFCEVEGDLQIINTIISNLRPETLKKVSIYNYKGDLKEAIKLIATFNLFIAARFHANIIAMLLGIGVMPIIYSNKTTNMLIDINLNEIKINMDELHLQYDEDIINRSINNKVNLDYISSLAKNHFNKINEFLEINVMEIK